MEIQADRKIKMLQFDHIGEYKDRFLQVGQNNNIEIHSTIGKHREVKEMNHFLLEKVQYLLCNASLDK